MRASSFVRIALFGVSFGLLVGCPAPESGDDTSTERGSGGSGAGGKSSGSGGSSSSGSGSGGSSGSSSGSGGSSPSGSGGSSPSGSGGSTVSGSGGSGSGGGGAADAGAPADAPSVDPNPGPPGAFPLCPKCKSIFDGKTLTGWQQSPAGSFEVKNGAIASTGKGAHAWTMEDYGDFRIFFTVRQIKGNHKPCTTLFTTRPGGANASRGLSGIQFQPPRGGSWDYRPGKNSGPNATNWIYPNPRPEFDVLKWHRCEILARASKGEFWGACCEIEGKDSCKGIEVLHYKDASAGKKGPFALMMHNPGLFDEFKDFWVETDPVGDELLSTK